MPSESLANLDDSSWNRLQEILERFERDSHRSSAKDWSKYVPPVGDRLRRAVLEELIRTDLELRWRRQKPILVEHYLRQWPELENQPCVPGLLAEEYQVRRKVGDEPNLAEYRKRFPAIFDEVAQLIEPAEERSPIQEPLSRRAQLTPSSMADSVGGAVGDTGFPFAGKFRKLRRIGAGATGEVWEARAPGGVPIAIKRIFSAVTLRAIQRERESLDLVCSGKLRHPFLLQVFGWWVEGDLLHIAMELADDNLDNLMRNSIATRQTPLSPAELHQFFIDAAEALDFLNHQHNILHRDVKPANMLIMANRLKLGDFGLSRMTENLNLAMGRTLGAGTPVFIAPEIISGMQTRYSDQYSLAVSYFYLRAGRPVFTGSVAELREKHQKAAPSFEGLPFGRDERKVLARALAKRPEDRFPDSATFVRELGAATGVLGQKSAMAAAAERNPPAGRRESLASGPGESTRPGVILSSKQGDPHGGAYAGNELANEPAGMSTDATFAEQTQAMEDRPNAPKDAASSPPSSTVVGFRSTTGSEPQDRPAGPESKRRARQRPKRPLDKDQTMQTPPPPAPPDPPPGAKTSNWVWQPLSRSNIQLPEYRSDVPEHRRRWNGRNIFIYTALVVIGVLLGTAAILVAQWVLG